MKIVLVSDTHNLHDQLPLVPCDILIHAGDMTMEGQRYEIESFSRWLRNYPAEFKVVIAGNHDWMFQRNKLKAIQLLHGQPDITRTDSNELFGKDGIYYLEDQSIILNGLKFYGSPWQPWFYDWAFNVQRGPELKKIWDKIPNDTDVLVTHGPPKGVLDRLPIYGDEVGCQDLLVKVTEVKPKIHAFGHIHCGRGYKSWNGTEFYNASNVDETYQIRYDPITVEI